MSTETEKADGFTARLLLNPALNDFMPLMKEEQVTQFLNINSAQLYPTLASEAFFPGKSWEYIYKLLSRSLMNTIEAQSAALLEKIIDKLDLNFIGFIRQQNSPHEMIKTELKKYTAKLIKRPDIHRACNGIFAALNYGIIDKYVDSIFFRRKYIHFELIKVQKLMRMAEAEIKNYLKVTMLLKPAVMLLMSETEGGQAAGSPNLIPQQFADKAAALICRELPVIPEPVIQSAVHSNMAFADNRFLEATSRLSAVFSARCTNYKHGQIVDRGADTPDKSWYNIARKNYNFYGYDIKVLEELSAIATENRW
jgi:hypothetical protein